MSHRKSNPAKIILIAGPTASGKSARALAYAQKQPAMIINADAMQIYEGLPILTAQPSAVDQKLVPHALYGVIAADQRSSVKEWLDRVHQSITTALASKRLPILVGGTGLYFKAFLQGLATIPDIPKEKRDACRELFNELGEEKFRKTLEKLDPLSAQKIARNDRQRLIRAYEVVSHTGQTLSYWHSQCDNKISEQYSFETHLHAPERNDLYNACNLRFTQMINRGAIIEVAKFLERKLDPELPAMKTIGVREIAGFLRKEISIEEAVQQAQQMTRNYAKRQLTWFRNQWPFPHAL